MPAIPDPEAKPLSVKEYFHEIEGKDMREIQQMQLPIPQPLWADWGLGSAYGKPYRRRNENFTDIGQKHVRAPP
jgi:hypothetical protein